MDEILIQFADEDLGGYGFMIAAQAVVVIHSYDRAIEHLDGLLQKDPHNQVLAATRSIQEAARSALIRRHAA